MKPGIYSDIPSATYHADCADTPSLSASIAGIIWHRTPLHGWMAHPKNPNRIERDCSATFDLGTIAHAIILEGSEKSICVIDADDWRTKAAKEKRDDARCAGLTPILAHQIAEVRTMAKAAHDFITESELAGILQDGKPEQTLIAEYEGIWLRGRLDWITNDRKIILDYKTVGKSALPESFLRSSVFSYGYDIQAAMYLHLNALTGGDENAKFVWLVQETEAPYACSLMGASPSLIESGRRKLDSIIPKWRAGVETGIWHGYGNRIAWLEAPIWELAKVEERELMEAEEWV